MKDIFISYNSADKKWAEWLAWQLTSMGYDVTIQPRDILKFEDFIEEMDRGRSLAKATMPVFSPYYISSDLISSELRKLLAEESRKPKRIIPIIVESSKLDTLIEEAEENTVSGEKQEGEVIKKLKNVAERNRLKPSKKVIFPPYETGDFPPKRPKRIAKEGWTGGTSTSGEIIVKGFHTDAEYNIGFYEHLIAYLNEARNHALVIGHGFDIDLSEEPRFRVPFVQNRSIIAWRYLRSMADLACRARLYRIEYMEDTPQGRGGEGKGWIRAIAKFLPFASDKNEFGLTILKPKKRALDLLTNLAVLDWSGGTPAAVLMLPRKEESGGSVQDYRAEVAFVTKSPLAVAMIKQCVWPKIFKGSEPIDSLFEVIRKPADLLISYGLESKGELDTDENQSDWDDLPYFAYGSNMNWTRASLRSPGIECVGTARFHRHQLAFRDPMIPGLGAVASIDPAPDGSFVEGFLYRMTRRDSQRMSFYEGVFDESYHKKEIIVTDMRDGRDRRAFTFVQSPEHPIGKPSPGYIKAIIGGTMPVRRGNFTGTLSEEYIRLLRKIENE